MASQEVVTVAFKHSGKVHRTFPLCLKATVTTS